MLPTTHIFHKQLPVRKGHHPYASRTRVSIQRTVTMADTKTREAMSLCIQTACGWGSVFCFRKMGKFYPVSGFYQVTFGTTMRKIIYADIA